MQFYNPNNFGDRRIKPVDFQILPARLFIFSKIRTIQVRAYTKHAKLGDRDFFRHKISPKRDFRFDRYSFCVNKMERPFFSIEIETRRDLARLGLVSRHHYHPQMKKIDIPNDPRWRTNIEATQSRFQLDRYRPFAFKHRIIAKFLSKIRKHLLR